MDYRGCTKQTGVLLCLILIVLGTSACPDSPASISSSSVHKSAKTEKPSFVLRIDLPKRVDTHKYFHELGENIILINKTGTLPLRLDCWAPYPIDLKFSGHLTNHETTVKTFRKEFGSGDVKKTCFIINATMDSYEQITGNYSCTAVDNQFLFSSYYIYVSPTPPGVILTRGQTIKIQPNAWDRSIIFPCAVSHPDVHVLLINNENPDDPLPLTNDLRYDPKVGFTMKFNALSDNFQYGNYSCRTELSPLDQVNFTVTPPPTFQVDPPFRNIRLSPQEQLNITCKSTEEFVIETLSGSDKLPIKISKVKYSPQAPYYKYFGGLISHGLDAKVSGYVSCKWNRTNKTFAIWTFSVSDTGPTKSKPSQLDPQKIVSSCPNASEIILHDCSNSLECRINSCQRKDATCYHHPKARLCPLAKDRNCLRAGLMQCPSKVSESMIFFTGFPDSGTNKTYRYVDWNHVSHEELLHLELSSETYIPPTKTNGKKKLVHLMFSCEGSNFVFSSGFKWKLFYKNGVVLLLNNFKGGENLNVSVRNSLKEIRSNLRSVLAISIESNELEEVARVECAAPIWNSYDWITQSFSLASGRSFKHDSLDSSRAPSNATPHFYYLAVAILFSIQLIKIQ